MQGISSALLQHKARSARHWIRLEAYYTSVSRRNLLRCVNWPNRVDAILPEAQVHRQLQTSAIHEVRALKLSRGRNL